MKPTLIFDTETTDLIKSGLMKLEQQPHIIEFYGCLLDEESGEIVREVDFLCHPGFEISEETTRITGITREMLKGLPSFRESADEVLRLIADAGAVVAHNLSYDFAMVRLEIERIGIMDPDDILWPIIRICTVRETEHMKGFRLSLSALHEELFGEPFKGAHRAKVDVEALTRCYIELKQRGEI